MGAYYLFFPGHHYHHRHHHHHYHDPNISILFNWYYFCQLSMYSTVITKLYITIRLYLRPTFALA